MFRIFGNVTLKETGEGIPNLVVTVFDTDQEELDLDRLPSATSEGAWADRLGSVLSDQQGRFELKFEKEDFQIGDQERRPDLMLVVFAPEDSRSLNEPSPLSPKERVLHVSRLPRRDAARTEAYAIRLLRAQLDRFDLLTTNERAAEPERFVETVVRALDVQDAIRLGLQPRLKREAEKAQALARKAKNVGSSLSTIPLPLRIQDPRFVSRPEDLVPAQKNAMDAGLARLSEYRGNLRVRLSDADLARLNSVNGEGGDHQLEVIDGRVDGEADASAVLAIVSERGGGMERLRSRGRLDACVPPERAMPAPDDPTSSSPSALIPLSRTAFAAAPAQRTTVAVRVESARGIPQAGIDVEFTVAEGEGLVSPRIVRSNSEGRAEATWILGAVEGTQSLTVTAVGLPTVTFAVSASEASAGLSEDEAEQRLIKRVIGQVEELKAADGLESLPSRPDQQKVQEAVQSLRLEGGPADATAFHDFHALQISFPHVWAEAFDGKLRRDAELLYTEVVRLAEYAGVEDEVLTAEIESLDHLIGKAEETAAAYEGDAGSYIRRTGDVPNHVLRAFPEKDAGEWIDLWAEMNPDEQAAVSLGTWERRARRRAEGAIASASLRLEKKRRAAFASRAEEPTETVAEEPTDRFPRLRRLLAGIRERLKEPYAFDLFAPGSYNFGIITTYRQEWEPLSYQAGELISTIPLAPGETRKFTKKEVVRKSRAVKEIAKSMSSRSEELSETRRAEAEIMRKASTATNFKHTAEGSFSIGIADLSGSTEFALNQAEESASNKKDFRESTIKAAEEYKQERELQVESTSVEEMQTTSSGEISNPNNELTVTYLFYELQRRYRISEHIHRVRPVVLIAQEVPAPHEIDEDWLLAHEWILRRVILDDSLLPALDHLSDTFTGDEVAVAIRRANWDKQRALVDKLEASVSLQMATRDALRDALITTSLGKDLSAARESSTSEDVGAFLAFGPASFLFGGSDEERTERLEAQRKAAEARLEYAEEALADAQRRLKSASEALAQASREYSDALQRRMNQRTAIDQLRIHVKQNILYYMQAIWDHEPADQRFFRLYRLKVKCPAPAEECIAEAIDPAAARHAFDPWFDPLRGVGGLPGPPPDRRPAIFELRCVPAISDEEVDLVRVADLDNPLGYKGNYIIFPLKERCYLTDYMMQEFVDDYFGVRDPDGFGDYTTEELGEFIRCVWHQPEVTDDDRAAMRELFVSRLSQPRRSSDEIIVPTGQLFIEALPGRHPLLEDFKLRHRMEDVRKVQAEVRHDELENLRLAARLVAGEREDPDIEKRILVDRDSDVVVDTE